MPGRKRGEHVSTPEHPRVEAFAFKTAADAQAYLGWKQQVPAPVRTLVEAALQQRPLVLQVTGLPRVDQFLATLTEALTSSSAKEASEEDSLIAQSIAMARTIETEEGIVDGIALFKDRDTSFAYRHLIWQKYLASTFDYLYQEDITPPPLPPTEPSLPEEGGGASEGVDHVPSTEKTPSTPPEPMPRRTAKEFQPGMDKTEPGKEGEAKAEFTVTPFFGGYYRTDVWSEWNPETLYLRRADLPRTALKTEALDPFSLRTLSATIPAGEEITLPIPYGWGIDLDSLQANFPRIWFKFTQNDEGSFFLQLKGSGTATFQVHIGKKRTPSELPPPVAAAVRNTQPLPRDLKRVVEETKGASLSLYTKAQLLLKQVREHLTYSQDEEMNGVYRANPSQYVQTVWREKKADCDVANTVAFIVLREAGIRSRLVSGYYVKGGQKDATGNTHAALTEGIKHAWLEVFDEEKGQWFRADATPKGDPTLDEDRPDEQDQDKNQVSGEGDYADKEAEIMTEEQLQELIKSLQEQEELAESTRTDGDIRDEAFVEETGCTKEEAEKIRTMFDRVRAMKDENGISLSEQMKDEWDGLLLERRKSRRTYKGPVRMDVGDELYDPAVLVADVRAGSANPSGFRMQARAERREEIFGGIDIYLMIDLSDSMNDLVKGVRKIEMQSDFVMLYVDSLMQCAMKSDVAAQDLTVPLSVRIQIVSISGLSAQILLPLTNQWDNRAKLALYRAVNTVAAGGTPDHRGLEVIYRTIKDERKKWDSEEHASGELRPIEFVAVSLDGGSDNPKEVGKQLTPMRKEGVIVEGFGITAAAKAITITYGEEHAQVVEDLSKHASTAVKRTMTAFKKLRKFPSDT